MFWDVKEDKDNINITTLCTHTKFRGVGAKIVNFFSGFKKGYQLHRLHIHKVSIFDPILK